MGLDVTAFGDLVRTRRETTKSVHLSDNPDFPGRDEGIQTPAHYTYGESMDVLSIGYGGYSIWRNQLAELAGYARSPDDPHFPYAETVFGSTEGPFWELINFADNEGTIGPVAAAKLARDFDDFADRAANHHSERFREAYDAFRRGFRMASRNGAVKFS